MTASSTQDILAEIWAIKDSLSASVNHDLKATCRALYAEQQKHPEDFVNLGAPSGLNRAESEPYNSFKVLREKSIFSGAERN